VWHGSVTALACVVSDRDQDVIGYKPSCCLHPTTAVNHTGNLTRSAWETAANSKFQIKFTLITDWQSMYWVTYTANNVNPFNVDPKKTQVLKTAPQRYIQSYHTSDITIMWHFINQIISIIIIIKKTFI